MANTRELSQLASLINVIDETRSIEVATAYPNANVGIGTLSPTSKVSVVGDVSVSGVITATSFSGDGSNLTGLSVDTGSTVSIGATPPESPSSGDLWYSTIYGRTFVYYEDDDSSQWVDSAPFRVGVVTTADRANTATVAEGLTGSPSISVENVNATGVITAFSFVGDGSGLTGIASTDNIVTSTPAEFNNTVTINDHLEVDNINVTGIVTAFDFDTLSDINFKTNIETVDDALYKVKNLRGVKFDWIQSGRPAYGVIAQELEKILPELVHGGYGIDPKTVNFNGIIGVLIEAVKELSERVEKLEKNENL